MFTYVVVYYQERNRHKNRGIYYPIQAEYSFSQEHYELTLNAYIPSVEKLAEYRLTNDERFDYAIVYTFRELKKKIHWNYENPEWCFYVTCLGIGRHKIGKQKYIEYQKFAKDSIMARHLVHRPSARPPVENFVGLDGYGY